MMTFTFPIGRVSGGSQSRAKPRRGMSGAAAVIAFGVLAFTLASETARAEFILSGAVRGLENSSGGMASSGTNGPEQDDRVAESKDPFLSLLDHRDPGAVPIGSGGCSGNPGYSFGGQNQSAAVAQHFFAPLLQLHERLAIGKLLLPPRPDPDVLLDPPKSC